MSYRPAYTHKDANHFIPRDFLRDACGGYEAVKFGRYASYTAFYRGVSFLLIDTSAFGGTMPDWILENRDNGVVRWLEVKTEEAYRNKNNGLKEAEMWLRDKSANFRIVVGDRDMQEIMNEMMEVKNAAS